MVRTLCLALALLLAMAGSAGAQPRIEVHDGATIPPGSTGIVDNTGTVEFGSANVAAPLNRIFTIRNIGNQNLVLTEPINVPNGFTVMRTFGSTVVPPGGTTQFTLALNAATAGRFTGGQISFGNNDTPRSPFNFTVTGSALPEAAMRTLDNSDAAFRFVGNWELSTYPGIGYQNNTRFKPAGNGTSVASWTFKGLTPGLYQVSTTYLAYSSWAPDARYTLRDATGALATITVNQQIPPADLQDAGVAWRNLGAPVLVSGDTLTVQLSDQATAGTWVMADAVRVERVGYVGRVLDDGSAGFTTTGTWTRDLLRGFQGDATFKGPGTGTATWTFSVPAGQYRVSATWREAANRATNAAFTIRNGATTLATVQVNQRVIPRDFLDGGTRWTDLGAPGTIYTTTGANALVVELNSTNANGVVVADAVRIERVNVPTQPTLQDTVRFLEQATWGPNSATIAAVRSQGIPGWLNANFASPITGYIILPVRHDDRNQPITGTPYAGCLIAPGQTDPTCIRENYTSYVHKRTFFTNAFYSSDQVRQRMAWNLHKIIVTDVGGVRGYGARFSAYLNILDWAAVGNYSQMLVWMTLNPNMGDYLDMVRSTSTRPNENYARELLQLFSIGLDELHPDGTPILTAQGDRVPTYNQATVEAFTRVLTGWNRQPNFATGVSNWIDYMNVVTNAQGRATLHDGSAKTLLQRSPRNRAIAASPGWPGTQPLAEYAWASFDSVIDNVYSHPNVGPYISKQLIQMMVTSNPSPGYVARVAAVFDRNRTSENQMREVARAVLLDPEARGDLKIDPNFGRLREPVQVMNSMARAFGVTSYNDRSIPSDGALSGEGANQLQPLEQDVFAPPSVFSYFMPDNIITGTNNLLGPEFQIYSTLSSVRRHNMINQMLQPNNGNPDTYGIAPSAAGTNRPVPEGTKLDLRTLETLTPQQLVDELDRVLFGLRMPAAMKARILQAVSVPQITTGLRRAKTALYLVYNAPEWMVQR